MKRATAFLAIVLGPAGMLLADGNTIETKATLQTTGASVDFRKELGVSSPSLSDLGLRIDSARAACDPVGLAVIASELSALEKSTGKTADIKSDALATEAITLAQQRNRSDELKAVAAILPEQAAAANLAQAADAAAKAEAAAATDKQNGVKSRGIGGTLYVDTSHIPEAVDVYVNGSFVGEISANSNGGTVYVGQPYGTTYLHAVGASSGWSCDRAIPQVTADFVWTILPP